MRKTFYHGTTDLFDIHRVLLPPSESGILREGFRTTHQDAVYITDSLKSAKYYAKEAAQQFGGVPVVLKVFPIGDLWKRTHGEFLCEKAKVIGREKLCVEPSPMR